MHWLALIRPGDWLIMVASAVLVGVSIPTFWQGGMADRASFDKRARSLPRLICAANVNLK
jgi:hypothetical protein